jgi:hypothetical protein
MGGADCTGPVIQQPAHLYLARRKGPLGKTKPGSGTDGLLRSGHFLIVTLLRWASPARARSGTSDPTHRTLTAILAAAYSHFVATDLRNPLFSYTEPRRGRSARAVGKDHAPNALFSRSNSF